MSFKEVSNLIIQLITSWQVILVTIVVFFYFFLVSYVARLHYKLKAPGMSRPPKMKKIPRKETSAAIEAELTEGSDDLGIEEEE
jgi:hypothetical protein